MKLTITPVVLVETIDLGFVVLEVSKKVVGFQVELEPENLLEAAFLAIQSGEQCPSLRVH